MPQDVHDVSIRYVKGVGPSRAKTFAHLGVESVEDLLYLFPRRYEDRRSMTTIAQLKAGEWHTIAGKITRHDSRKTWHTRKHVCEIIIDDGTGCIYGVWFNQPYLSAYFKLGQQVILHGKVETYKERLQIVSPEYEIIEEEESGESLSIGRIVPVYPLTRGMTQRYLRRIIKLSLNRYASKIADILPYDLRKKYNLMNAVKSLANIHFPESFEAQEQAFARISFEEFFLFQVSILMRKLSITQRTGIAHDAARFSIESLEACVPFSLTAAQKRVIAEITADMAAQSPMHRLLQGEVGSGKTLVAFYGCLLSIANGHQAVIMVPTEILAQQHFAVAKEVIAASAGTVKPGLLVGSLTKKQKDALHKKIKNGTVNLIIGTHALIQEAIDFNNVSLVVIDEQHKFGVRQRALLPEKGGNPDVLIMTATPIPRTLCLTLYGDLDISTIDELPPGRGRTSTEFFTEDDAARAYAVVYERVARGQQAYIVYPIIEESAKLDVKAAQAMYAQFQREEFKGFRIGLVHGQMARSDAVRIMENFKKKKLDILVATTILEVGVDVPNANVIVIEHAERFGLAQLHQLRGRIGRGMDDALCVLLATPTTAEAQARIDAIISTTDGFEIAQKDLMIRGPGKFFGRHQHGLNELRVADPETQIDILENARCEAAALTQADPLLAHPGHTAIRTVIEKRYPTYLSLVRAG